MQLKREQIAEQVDEQISSKAVVKPEDIAKVVSSWTGVPVTQMKRNEKREERSTASSKLASEIVT